MNRIGLSLDIIALLITKYNFEISSKDLNTINTRLTNQIWKLIPMKENNEDWIKQIETLIIELSGLNEVFNNKTKLVTALAKLEGLRINPEIDFFDYRKTVFEVISLIQELKQS